MKIRQWLVAFVMVFAVGVAIALSKLWGVAYIFTAIGFSALVLLGHLVTIDDDLPGGWSNPDGTVPFPWRNLLIKGLVLVGLCLLALFPAVRALGSHK